MSLFWLQNSIWLAGLRSFSNNFDKNVISFGVDNSLLSHSDNRKNDFLVLGVGPTYDLNSSFESPDCS